jgi:lipopolysaccharide O-acetyltransferase
MQTLAQHLRENGLMWTVPALCGALATRVRSAFAARALNAPGLSLGPGSQLLGVRHVQWGRDVSIRSRLWLEAVTRYAGEEFRPVIVIGDRTRFSEAVHITAIERVEIGKDVLLGSNIFIGDHQHGSYRGSSHSDPAQPPSDRPLVVRGPVIIEDRVWIADGAHIVGPCRIGEGAVVGAHALVRGDVPPRSMVAGAPARVIKVFDGASGQWVAPVSAGLGGPHQAAFAAAPRDSSSPS